MRLKQFFRRKAALRNEDIGMTISVAMATYNGEKYIHDQIESILSQTRVPDEIIITDDCSTDETLRIAQGFADANPNIIWKISRNENNKGYIKNFLDAISQTTGDVIILSDQDDVWADNKVELIQSYFETYPDMLSLHMDYAIINSEKKLIKGRQIKYKKPIEKYDIKAFTKRLNYCRMSSAFSKKIKDYLYKLEPDILPTHDWTIHAIAALQDGMYVSSDLVSFRRAHENNVALALNDVIERTGVDQRIKVVADYYNAYSLLKKIDETIGHSSYTKLIDRLKYIQNKRLGYLKDHKVLSWARALFDINYFPSYKAYICDALYIVGIF